MLLHLPGSLLRASYLPAEACALALTGAERGWYGHERSLMNVRFVGRLVNGRRDKIIGSGIVL